MSLMIRFFGCLERRMVLLLNPSLAGKLSRPPVGDKGMEIAPLFLGSKEGREGRRYTLC